MKILCIKIQNFHSNQCKELQTSCFHNEKEVVKSLNNTPTLKKTLRSKTTTDWFPMRSRLRGSGGHEQQLLRSPRVSVSSRQGHSICSSGVMMMPSIPQRYFPLRYLPPQTLNHPRLVLQIPWQDYSRSLFGYHQLLMRAKSQFLVAADDQEVCLLVHCSSRPRFGPPPPG